MPLNYTIHAKGSLILERGSGILSDADVTHHFQTLAKDDRIDPSPHVLSDLRGVEHIDLTEHGFRKALRDQDRIVADKTAIVAPVDLTFGLSRIYETLATELGNEVQVFRNWSDALHWLGAENLDLDE